MKSKAEYIYLFFVCFSLCASCTGRNQTEESTDTTPETECFSEIMEREIESVIRSVREGNAADFASLCRYPIERDYPLHDVIDSCDMVARYAEIFDAEITDSVSASVAEDWGCVNWRGYTFGNGEYLWIDDAIYRIPYHSKLEKKRREQLVKEDLASLPSALSDGWFPELCLLDTVSETVYRLDVREPDSNVTESRLMAYDKDENLKSIPSLILIGHKELQGSAGIPCYIFPRGCGTEWAICNLWPENQISFQTDQKDGMTESHNLKKIYWLDLVSS